MSDEDYFREIGYFKIDHAQRAREDAQRARQRTNQLMAETEDLGGTRHALERIIGIYGKCTCKKAQKQCIRCVAEEGLGRYQSSTETKSPVRGHSRRHRRHRRLRGKK